MALAVPLITDIALRVQEQGSELARHGRRLSRQGAQLAELRTEVVEIRMQLAGHRTMLRWVLVFLLAVLEVVVRAAH